MSNIKILLVEDDLFLKQLYTEILKNEGYLVDTASDGEDAYNKIMQGGWDLILLDIMLPKVDGLEVMRRVRKESQKQPYKKTVFLTNLDHDGQLKEAKELADGYLIKSDLTPDQFLEKVKEYLGSN